MNIFDLNDLKETVLSTGFTDINNVLGGGVKKGSLIILGARPGMGKTSLMLCLASNIAIRGESSVLIISMQHTKKQITSILLSQESGLNTRYMLSGENIDTEDMSYFNRACQILKKASIEIISKGLDSESLISTIGDAMKEEAYNVILIDDLSALKVPSGQSIREEISKTYRSLKSISLNTGVPIIVSQGVTRQPDLRMNKRPFLSELAECDSASSISDVVLFLYRDEYYNPDSMDKNTAEVIVAKNKMGPTGSVRLYFEASLQKYGNLLAV